MTELLEHAPAWLLRPLPANATMDAALHARIDELAANLPESLRSLHEALDAVKPFAEYDAAANRAAVHVWAAHHRLFTADVFAVRRQLLAFAAEHLAGEAQARVLRRLAKDPAVHLRSIVHRTIRKAGIREVALPLGDEGAWDTSGWLQGTQPGRLAAHDQGGRIQQERGLPVLPNLAAVRQLLDIRSPRQLGFLLVASDHDDGPYTRFTISKRSGAEREICAPKPQLRWVQRRLLDEVLAKVPPHGAAHGFVPGRSTVTNAVPHRGAKLVLKFDLTDFFPTIHYYRVVGLFASLGYYVGNGRFSSDDASRQVAPTLARLCCYARDPTRWGAAVVPQGAPTSPALSNLVCRRLDARLEGLAKRNQGVYTRYADDLTFSFQGEGPNLGRFRWWVDQVCHQEGFFVNQSKFHVIRASQRQVVTGIVVNDDLRVPRDVRRRFRAILHNCRKFGLESQAHGHPRFADYLRGFASYIHMVHPEEGVDLLEQVNALLTTDNTDEHG